VGHVVLDAVGGDVRESTRRRRHAERDGRNPAAAHYRAPAAAAASIKPFILQAGFIAPNANRECSTR